MSTWKVQKELVRTDYIQIEDLQQFLVQDVPMIHPEHPIYTKFWSKELKRCIEGLWGYEFGQYRYMPGNLYFFGNYGVIEHTFQRGSVNVTEEIKPLVVDYLWDFAYISCTCYGFSGFEKDTKVSCNIKLKQYYEGKLTHDKLPQTCFHNGVLKNYEEPYEYIRKLHVEKLGKPLFENPTTNNLILGCLQGEVNVRMFDGSVKKAKDVVVGDELMGVDSTKRTVQTTFTGDAPMFEVNSRYGDPYTVTDSHLLHTQRRSGNFKTTVNQTIGEILDDAGTYKSVTVEGIMSNAIEYPEQELILHPYFIGLWLGDGFKREKMICVNQDDDKEILEWLIDHANSDSKLSYSITTSKNGLSEGHTTRFTLKHDDLKTKNNWFGRVLRNNKHVPKEYKINSLANRLELLAGVIDSDGCAEKSRYTVTSVDYNLLKDIQEVARSCGFRAKIHKPSVTGLTDSLKYNLRITGDIHKIPCKLSRKKAPNNSSGKGSNRNDLIFTAKGVDKFYGFELDGDHLYLLEDYTVTHNSRGGSKSYFVAIAEIEYNFIFGGARRYDQKFLDGEYKAQQCCGAGDSNKSSEMLNKFLASQNAKTNGESKKFKEWFGIWTELNSKGETVTTPCPLYRRSLGTLDCPNKKPHKIYRSKYKVDINGQFVERGTGSTIAHVNYSTKKGDGFRASEGGRYLFSNCEEVGSMENFIDVLGANEGTVSRGGNRFGVQWAQGTSGHIEYIQATKKVFLNPEDYNMLPFKNQFGHTGKNGNICYFIPYYITLLGCKDKNGNTDYDLAIEEVNKQREKEASSSDPKVLRDFLMNKPCYVDEMWLSDKGYYLPYEEAAAREKQLTAFDTYKMLETPIKLIWDSSAYNGVRYEVIHNAEPYREFPIDSSKKKDPSGCIVMYEQPQFINGHIPYDLYQFVGLDPYVEEDIDRGGSIASLFILINPKYIPQGFNGNCIAASYIGKPVEGLSVFYENVEKLLAMYGNPIQGLCFEKNRGESCREHFIRKSKTNLLMVTPQNTVGNNIYQKNIISFGYNVGNKVAKLNMVKMLHDWLLEETTLSDGTKKNIERIPCLFLIRQIMQYNMEDNFDAVDGFRGCILALREYETKLQAESNKKELRSNDFKSYKKNEKIFKQQRSYRFS